MPRRGPTIAQTSLQLIRQRGPQLLDTLVDEIVAAGLTRAKDPRRAVRAAIDADPGFLQAWDGRWCSIVEQLDGAIFTTPLLAIEREDGVVLLRDDLDLLRRLALRSRPFAGGGEVHLDYFADFFGLPWPSDELDAADMRGILGDELADRLLEFVAELGLPIAADEQDVLRDLVWEMRFTQVLHGPPGWLPRLGPRQLLGIRLRSGEFETVALDPRDVAGPHVGIVGARVARLARLVIGPDASWFGPPAISLDELLELVATEAPELLHRPLPPLREVVERGGLEFHDGWVGHPGTDWRAWERDLLPGSEAAWGFEPPHLVH